MEEEVITLETIYNAVQALADNENNSIDEETKENIKNIYDSLYYYNSEKDENGDITVTKVNRLEELNNSIEKNTLSINTIFASLLFILTAVILIKTFFTGW